MWAKATRRLCALAAVALLAAAEPSSAATAVHSGYPQWERFFDRELTAADGHARPAGDKRRFGLLLPDDHKVETAKKRRFGLTLPDEHMMGGGAKRRFGLTLPDESMVGMKKRRFGLMLPNDSMVEAKRRFSLMLPDDKLMGNGGAQAAAVGARSSRAKSAGGAAR